MIPKNEILPLQAPTTEESQSEGIFLKSYEQKLLSEAML